MSGRGLGGVTRVIHTALAMWLLIVASVPQAAANASDVPSAWMQGSSSGQSGEPAPPGSFTIGDGLWLAERSTAQRGVGRATRTRCAFHT